ncbi:MAG: hypothetical protein SV375_10205 [Thermodesulfobacteriota bacterium]|nr:hypothetical protein [Thermodesulfobacteriota bacterium]
MAAIKKIICHSVILILAIAFFFLALPAHAVEVWKDPTKYGIFFVWYAPSFYTGFAPRSQDPDRIHIHLGRGNQLRVTVVLSDDIINHYLEDLVIRADMYQALVNKKIITLTQNMAYERFVEKMKAHSIRENLAKKDSMSPSDYFRLSLETIEKLNPGRLFHISMPLEPLLNKWLTQVAGEGEIAQMADEDRLILINDLLPTRLWYTAITPSLRSGLDRVASAGTDKNAVMAAAKALFATACGKHYPVNKNKVDFYEFTTIYVAGTVNRTTKHKGHSIPDYPINGVWHFIPRKQGRGLLGMVDYISPNPGYGYITMLPYQHAGGIYYNAIHNAGVRTPLGKTFLPREWRGIRTERPPHKKCQNLWIASRSHVSHGCTRIPSGHMNELRNIIPSHSETLKRLKHFRNRPYLYDVFDVDGDGEPQVMGLRYYLAYKCAEPRDPIRILVQNTREDFYPWIYGPDFKFNPDSSVVFNQIMDARFVGKRALEGKTYRDISLYEPEYPEEAMQFYLLKKASFSSNPGYEFNRELRKIGYGYKPDLKKLFLE